MKKERQIGIRVGLPVFFALELEDVYKHTEGAHRALAFPDFVGLLVGMGLEAYHRGKPIPYEKAPEDIEKGEDMGLFDLSHNNLQDLFRDFDEAMEPHEERPSLHLIQKNTANM